MISSVFKAFTSQRTGYFVPAIYLLVLQNFIKAQPKILVVDA